MCRAFDYQNKKEIGQRYNSLSDITPTSMSCSGRSRALLAQGVGDFLDIPRGEKIYSLAALVVGGDSLSGIF